MSGCISNADGDVIIILSRDATCHVSTTIITIYKPMNRLQLLEIIKPTTEVVDCYWNEI